LQDNVTNEFPYTLLGKPVFLSENMDTIAATKKTILYGDYSGIAVKISENVEIQVLMEKYATQHAVGIVGYFEFDSKIMDEQRLAVLVQKA
jgi:HK97 family phage major capsid protein